MAQFHTWYGPVKVSEYEAWHYRQWLMLLRNTPAGAVGKSPFNRLLNKVDLFRADCERVAKFKYGSR